MDDMNSIGLHEGSASQLAEKLNHLLANYQIFYMNVRGYHWNVKGNDFFELHAKFEEFYTDLLTKVDEVAERILTLGHEAPLQTGGKTSTTAALEAGVFHSLQHIFRAQALRDQLHTLVAIAGLVGGDIQWRPGHVDVLC